MVSGGGIGIGRPFRVTFNTKLTLDSISRSEGINDLVEGCRYMARDRVIFLVLTTCFSLPSGRSF